MLKNDRYSPENTKIAHALRIYRLMRKAFTEEQIDALEAWIDDKVKDVEVKVTLDTTAVAEFVRTQIAG